MEYEAWLLRSLGTVKVKMVWTSTREPPSAWYYHLHCDKVVLCYGYNSRYGPGQLDRDTYALSSPAVLPMSYALMCIDQCFALCPAWTFLVLFFHLVLVCKTCFIRLRHFGARH